MADYEPLLAAIQQAEAGVAGFDAINNGSNDNLQNLTLSDVAARKHDPRKVGSGAAGAYQIMPFNIEPYAKRAGVGLDEPFNADNQKKLAVELLKDAGVDKLQDGRLDPLAFQDNTSRIWAGIGSATEQTRKLESDEAPVTIRPGESYYRGVQGNKASLPNSVYQSAISTFLGQPVAPTPEAQPDTPPTFTRETFPYEQFAAAQGAKDSFDGSAEAKDAIYRFAVKGLLKEKKKALGMEGAKKAVLGVFPDAYAELDMVKEASPEEYAEALTPRGFLAWRKRHAEYGGEDITNDQVVSLYASEIAKKKGRFPKLATNLGSKNVAAKLSTALEGKGVLLSNLADTEEVLNKPDIAEAVATNAALGDNQSWLGKAFGGSGARFAAPFETFAPNLTNVSAKQIEEEQTRMLAVVDKYLAKGTKPDNKEDAALLVKALTQGDKGVVSPSVQSGFESTYSTLTETNPLSPQALVDNIAELYDTVQANRELKRLAELSEGDRGAKVSAIRDNIAKNIGLARRTRLVSSSDINTVGDGVAEVTAKDLTLGQKAIHSVVGSAGPMIVGIAAAGLTRGRILPGLVGATPGAVSQGVESASSAIEKGKDFEDALTIGVGNMGAEYAGGVAPTGALVNLIKQFGAKSVKRKLLELGTLSVVDGAGEVLTDRLQQEINTKYGVDDIYDNPNLTPEEKESAAEERRLLAFITGAGQSAVLGGTLGSANALIRGNPDNKTGSEEATTQEGGTAATTVVEAIREPIGMPDVHKNKIGSDEAHAGTLYISSTLAAQEVDVSSRAATPLPADTTINKLVVDLYGEEVLAEAGKAVLPSSGDVESVGVAGAAQIIIDASSKSDRVFRDEQTGDFAPVDFTDVESVWEATIANAASRSLEAAQATPTPTKTGTSAATEIPLTKEGFVDEAALAEIQGVEVDTARHEGNQNATKFTVGDLTYSVFTARDGKSRSVVVQQDGETVGMTRYAGTAPRLLEPTPDTSAPNKIKVALSKAGNVTVASLKGAGFTDIKRGESPDGGRAVIAQKDGAVYYFSKSGKTHTVHMELGGEVQKSESTSTTEVEAPAPSAGSGQLPLDLGPVVRYALDVEANADTIRTAIEPAVEPDAEVTVDPVEGQATLQEERLSALDDTAEGVDAVGVLESDPQSTLKVKVSNPESKERILYSLDSSMTAVANVYNNAKEGEATNAGTFLSESDFKKRIQPILDALPRNIRDMIKFVYTAEGNPAVREDGGPSAGGVFVPKFDLFGPRILIDARPGVRSFEGILDVLSHEVAHFSWETWGADKMVDLHSNAWAILRPQIEASLQRYIVQENVDVENPTAVQKEILVNEYFASLGTSLDTVVAPTAQLPSFISKEDVAKLRDKYRNAVDAVRSDMLSRVHHKNKDHVKMFIEQVLANQIAAVAPRAVRLDIVEAGQVVEIHPTRFGKIRYKYDGTDPAQVFAKNKIAFLRSEKTVWHRLRSIMTNLSPRGGGLGRITNRYIFNTGAQANQAIETLLLNAGGNARVVDSLLRGKGINPNKLPEATYVETFRAVGLDSKRQLARAEEADSFIAKADSMGLELLQGITEQVNKAIEVYQQSAGRAGVPASQIARGIKKMRDSAEKYKLDWYHRRYEADTLEGRQDLETMLAMLTDPKTSARVQAELRADLPELRRLRAKQSSAELSEKEALKLVELERRESLDGRLAALQERIRRKVFSHNFTQEELLSRARATGLGANAMTLLEGMRPVEIGSDKDGNPILAKTLSFADIRVKAKQVGIEKEVVDFLNSYLSVRTQTDGARGRILTAEQVRDRAEKVLREVIERNEYRKASGSSASNNMGSISTTLHRTLNENDPADEKFMEFLGPITSPVTVAAHNTEQRGLVLHTMASVNRMAQHLVDVGYAQWANTPEEFGLTDTSLSFKQEGTLMPLLQMDAAVDAEIVKQLKMNERVIATGVTAIPSNVVGLQKQFLTVLNPGTAAVNYYSNVSNLTMSGALPFLFSAQDASFSKTIAAAWRGEAKDGGITQTLLDEMSRLNVANSSILKAQLEVVDGSALDRLVHGFTTGANTAGLIGRTKQAELDQKIDAFLKKTRRFYEFGDTWNKVINYVLNRQLGLLKFEAEVPRGAYPKGKKGEAAYREEVTRLAVEWAGDRTLREGTDFANSAPALKQVTSQQQARLFVPDFVMFNGQQVKINVENAAIMLEDQRELNSIKRRKDPASQAYRSMLLKRHASRVVGSTLIKALNIGYVLGAPTALASLAYMILPQSDDDEKTPISKRQSFVSMDEMSAANLALSDSTKGYGNLSAVGTRDGYTIWGYPSSRMNATASLATPLGAGEFDIQEYSRNLLSSFVNINPDSPALAVSLFEYVTLSLSPETDGRSARERDKAFQKLLNSMTPSANGTVFNLVAGKDLLKGVDEEDPNLFRLREALKLVGAKLVKSDLRDMLAYIGKDFTKKSSTQAEAKGALFIALKNRRTLGEEELQSLIAQEKAYGKRVFKKTYDRLMPYRNMGFSNADIATFLRDGKTVRSGLSKSNAAMLAKGINPIESATVKSLRNLAKKGREDYIRSNARRALQRYAKVKVQ